MSEPRRSPGEPQLKLRPFLAACIYDFHKAVYPHGLAQNGAVIVRELLPVGRCAVQSYYESDDLRAEFEGYSDVHEDFMVMLSIDLGLVVGAFWYADRDIFDILAWRAINAMPISAAEGLIDALYDQPIMDDSGAPLFDLIFERFTAMLEPYRSMPNAHNYVICALLAAFQLGLTLMFERCEC